MAVYFKIVIYLVAERVSFIWINSAENMAWTEIVSNHFEFVSV